MMMKSISFLHVIVFLSLACHPCITESASADISLAKTGVVTVNYDFGVGRSPEADVSVSPDTAYSPDRGYGFDFDSSVRAKALGGGGVLQGCIVSDKAFYFSVDLPEGNYRVTATVGPSGSDFRTTIRSETRRLMIEDALTHKGEVATYSFIANVRGTSLPDGGQVRLKDRETSNLHWDGKLTLEFAGSSPQVSALQIESAPDVITVYLAGDSTVCDQPEEPWNSWGQMLPRFFKPYVAVANHAMSGESIASSLESRRFDKIFSLIKPGDYLFIQFGHNDMKDAAPGAIGTYRANLGMLAEKTRSMQATPVFVTSMERKQNFAGDTLKGYPDAMREVARDKGVALIDLNRMSKRLYEALGPDLDRAFVDGTHHNAYGSYQLARCVVEGIRSSDLGLGQYLVDDLPHFDPAKPDPVDRFGTQSTRDPED